MKIKKPVLRLSTIVFLLLASIVLAACNPSAGGGPSTGGGGGGGNSTVPSDPGPNPIPSDPNNNPDTPISDLFSRYKVITTGQDVTIADPTTGTIKQFNDLLDRQIDVLATDILYRLAVVYGNGFESTQDSFNINLNYSYNNKNALIDNKNIITSRVNGEYYDETYLRIREPQNTTPVIDDAAYHAYSIENSGIINYYFNKEHAISGGYYWDIDEGEFDESLNLNTSYAWLWNYSGTGIDHTGTEKLFTKYINTYKEQLKSAIAQILASPENSNPSINYYANYENFLNDISYLGFTAGDRQKIENFVLNEVIGTSNITKDEQILNDVISVLGSNVLSTSIINDTFLETEELHYYKAYNVLVPKMIERAFSNAFGGEEVNRIIYADAPTNTSPLLVDGKVQYSSLDELENITDFGGAQFVSLYPKMTRSKDTDLNIAEQDPNTNDAPEFLMLGVQAEIKSVILQPKQGSSVKGLFMAVSGEEGVTFDFKINLKYVAKGVEHANGYVSHLVSGEEGEEHANGDVSDQETGSETSEIYTVSGKYDTSFGEGYDNMPYYFALNIVELIKTDPYPTFNNYNGINSGNQNLWNNPYSFDGYKLAGDNYLELSFEIVNATKNNTPYNGEVKFDIGFADPY